MTETERLRELLTERGVEWYEPTMKPNTTWFPDAYGINCRVKPWGDALCVKRYDLTPEQAVEATLGRGTCQMEFLEAAQFSDEDMRHYFEVGVYRCSECGTETYGRWTEGEELERPDFCPACGRRAVG